LTKIEIDRLAKIVGLHRIEENLFLRVRPGGGGTRAAWQFHYTLNGQERRPSFGSYREVSLTEARDRAHDYRKLLVRGIDPIEQHRQEKSKVALSRTFREAAEDYIENRQGKVTPKSIKVWRLGMAKYFYPKIGEIPVNTISVADANAVCVPMAKAVPSWSKSLRGVAVRIINHAVANGFRLPQPNPFAWKGNLEFNAAYPFGSELEYNHPALPWQQIGELMEKVRQRGDHIITRPGARNLGHVFARALEFLILTGVRPANAASARWEDIDLNQRVWTIRGFDVTSDEPVGTGMKMKRPHRVPLSTAAIALLQKQQGQHPQFVFPGLAILGQVYTPIDPRGMQRFLNTLEYKDETGRLIHAHGFRTTFRGWASAMTKYEFAVAELALAHDERTPVQRAYDRDDRLEARRPLMEDWGQFCSKPYAPEDTVVPFRRAQGE
jgi:integrase